MGIIRVLGWIGARARWVLAFGVLIAFFLPGLSAMLRPWLGSLVALVFAVALARIDLAGLVRRLARPRQLARLALWSLALMAVTPGLLWMLGEAMSLPPAFTAAMVYAGATPPITSAAALCLMIGLNAAFALELTVVASLLTPLIGPLVAAFLLGSGVPVDPLVLGVNLGAIIVFGGAGAILLRLSLGPHRIESHARAFDGLSALVMWLVVVSVLDRAGPLILSDPGRALGILALAVCVNFGMQAIAAILSRRFAPEVAGAAGLVWGNRTVALYLAALPFDPVFALFVAVFQIPMLTTPLVMGGMLRWAERTRR